MPSCFINIINLISSYLCIASNKSHVLVHAPDFYVSLLGSLSYQHNLAISAMQIYVYNIYISIITLSTVVSPTVQPFQVLVIYYFFLTY